MALAFQLQGAGFTPTELDTEAAVTLEPEGQGFRISHSALTLRAQVPNLDETIFAQLAADAEKKLPRVQGAQCDHHAGRKIDLRRRLWKRTSGELCMSNTQAGGETAGDNPRA